MSFNNKVCNCAKATRRMRVADVDGGQAVCSHRLPVTVCAAAEGAPKACTLVTPPNALNLHARTRPF